jgi:hypothetical protein
LHNSFEYFAVISTVFPVQKNYVGIKNNKIAIKYWQTLTLFSCKTGKFSTPFSSYKFSIWSAGHLFDPIWKHYFMFIYNVTQFRKTGLENLSCKLA